MTDPQAFEVSLDQNRQSRQPTDIARGAPKAVQLLVPVWGPSFISQFLQVSLPTLLAQGNLPSIAKALPCKIVFLTTSEDAADLRSHPGIHYLQNICEVEFCAIDDLITGDNYSTTITLAYARAVRAAGREMLHTCFFFMISDYIIADGSLSQVLARMQAGYSGVVAGNFQIVEEEALKSFFHRFDTGGPAIAIQSRDLMQWAIDYLHPMTLANMVNYPLCHSIHSNRLFWRVDENTLVGRFYLMHMICIRPERTDFVVGSSCDYSFIPEMCPSGKVNLLTDSDDYLVVEMQKLNHERNFVRLGPLKQSILIDSLAEWTTAVHRNNAHAAVVYHASDMPPQLEATIAESTAYIGRIESLLPPPQPYRNHPYWLGAMAAHNWAVSQKKKYKSAGDFNIAGVEAGGFYGWLYRLRNVFFGRPPRVHPWHPRWPDYRMFMRVASRHLEGKKGSLLVISSAAAVFANFFGSVSHAIVSLDLARFLGSGCARYESEFKAVENCIFVLNETQISRGRELIKKTKRLLPANGTLLVLLINSQGASVGRWFKADILQDVSRLYESDLSIDEVVFVPAGRTPWIALRGMQRALRLVQKNRLWIGVEFFVVAFLTVISFLSNITRHGTTELSNDQVCSSLAVVMRKTGTRSSPIDSTGEEPIDLVGPRWDQVLPFVRGRRIKQSERFS